ncbi:MAG: murein hydrolase activator EnvC family protein [Solirubrobacteraceae bacterium]
MRRSNTQPTQIAGALVVATIAVAAAIVLLVGGSRAAHAATRSQLQQRISDGQSRVSALAGAVSSANRAVSRLSASAAALERQVMGLQADLNSKQAELLVLRSGLDAARARLARLEAAQAQTQAVLSQQLVGSYEAGSPDLVSVVLDATGFQNLLELLSFEQRIGQQDARIVGQVRAARRAVAAEAVHLGALSARQQALTAQALADRNRVARARVQLVSEQLAMIRVRDSKAGQLSAARSQVALLRAQLGRLITAEQRAAAAAPTGAGSAGSPPAAPVTRSSAGGFTFPMPKGDVSPPSTWTLDQGVDISAPGGTPELAVCSGTIVLHGIGGFGPSAPVLHCDSPLDGYDYVYYGHAGPGNWTPVGTHVSQGQVISQVGYGIVGISSGPHLEIGFADSSGSPIGPSTAPTMMSLLRAAYGA